MHLIRSRLGLSLVAAGVLVGGLAVDVGALAAPGDHLQAGPATITPDVDLGLEFRTNVRRADVGAEAGANLRVAPGLTIELEQPGTDFSLSGEYELRKYVQPQFTSYDRFNDFQLGADLDAGKQQALGLRLSDQAVLRNLEVENGTDSPFSTQFRNRLGGMVVARPGPVLDIGLGAAWAIDNYQVPGNTAAARDYNTRNGVGPAWDVQWRFFPRTAVALEGEYTLNRWASNSVDGLSLPNSNFFRLSAGMRGRLTERLVLVTMLGYGSGKYTDDRNVAGLDRLLAQLQIKYLVGVGRNLSVGYVKSVEDSYFTNYVGYHRVFGAFDGRFGTRMGVKLGLSTLIEGFHGDLERIDTKLRAEGDLTYYMQDWASITAGTYYTQRLSDDSQVEYADVNVHLMATFTY
jgi:hypothetical protein